MKRTVVISMALAMCAVMIGCGLQTPKATPDAGIVVPRGFAPTSGPYVGFGDETQIYTELLLRAQESARSQTQVAANPYAGYSDAGQIYSRLLKEVEEDAALERQRAEGSPSLDGIDDVYLQWMETAQGGGWY